MRLMLLISTSKNNLSLSQTLEKDETWCGVVRWRITLECVFRNLYLVVCALSWLENDSLSSKVRGYTCYTDEEVISGNYSLIRPLES